MIIDVHVPRDENTTRQLFRFGDAVPATYMYGNPLVPTILAQHAMCKVRGLVRTNITQPKSIALLIDDAEQCKEFCGRHQDCKLDHMASSQCSTGMFQETCGHEPIQISILRPNSANENAKKHCDALDVLKQAVGIETDSEEANDDMKNTLAELKNATMHIDCDMRESTRR